MKLNVVLLLAVVNFIHCDECKLLFDLAIVEIGGSLRTIYNHLKGHDQLLQRIPDMQDKLEHLENNLQGLSRETAQCLQGEDLENLTNVSAAANQEIKSFHEEMFEVIAWSRKDKCSEGSLLCGQLGSCKNNPFSFTCSCPSGFTWDGSECKDVDECAEGKDDCVPNATCKNSIGSYSCSCNKPFKGDGRTSCEFKCRRPAAKNVPGVGCIMVIQISLSFDHMKKKCKEEGGRLAQHMSLEQLQNIGRSFGYHGPLWVDVYDGKWTSDRSLVPEALWLEGYRSDPSKPCAALGWEFSSSYKLKQWDCSQTFYGYCQFPMP
ncbi:protein kinase C-binding protein NELL2a-like isoform X3 [Palaemon carinicauda]|uniref:protein kinase C-binding protein NELL2a-like isoform X3 n=1 Tax=Palaemon carinicauda TaxID=392227 RepID=UPI0035B57CB3